MLRFSLTSLRSRAIILVLLAILPVLALNLYSYFDQRQIAIRDMQKDQLAAARNLATVQETLIGTTRQLLTTLARMPQVQQHDRDGCNALLARIAAQSPYYGVLLAVDSQGQMFAIAPGAPGPANYVDRMWFQKTVQSLGFVIGEPLQGRTTNKYLINLAYPILDDAGRLQGVLTAGLDLTWLGSQLAKNNFPSSTAMDLTDSTGKVLYRYPEPLKYVGKMLPEALIQAMAAGNEGVAAGGGLPGDERLFAFTRLSPPWQELRVAIGLPTEWAIDKVNRGLRRNLIWLGSVAILALAAAWYGGDLFVVRPVRKLRSVTERLAGRDLSVRAGPDHTVGELSLLAHSFDQMADSLQAREKDLRESEERFRTMANAIPQLAWMAKSDGYIFWYNQRWHDYTGTTPEDMEGRGWQSIHDPEVLPKVLEQWQISIATGEPFDMVFPLRGADGQFRQFLTRVMPLKDSHGNMLQWFGTNTDITERQLAEEALRRNREDLNRAQAVAHVGSWRLNVQKNDLTWSDENHRIFGIPPGTPMTYETFFGTLHPEDREYVDQGWRAALKGEPYDIDHRIMVDDKVKWVRERVALEFDSEGHLLGGFGTTQDITERRRAEEELKRTLEDLERSNRELEEFAYISSHDLQEPLRQVANFSEMLATEYQERLDERALRYFGYITTGARRMQVLVNDLLSYSRVGQAEIPKVPASLEDILKATLNDLETLIRESGADISFDPLPTLKVHPNQMALLLQNLLVNSIKFHNEKSPRIHLSARQQGGEWEISIRDNGIGFDPQYAESIFKVFKRMHSQEKYPGTGIGLAICKKIVERHSGRIWAESQLDRGATFYFTIPA